MLFCPRTRLPIGYLVLGNLMLTRGFTAQISFHVLVLLQDLGHLQ